MQRTGRIARHVVAKPAASRPAAVATAAAARASSTAAAAEGPLSEEQVERYHRDGFVVRISSPCAAVDVASALGPQDWGVFPVWSSCVPCRTILKYTRCAG